MALSSNWSPDFMAAIMRQMLFAELHKAHAKAWNRTFYNASDFNKFYEWRMAWWRDLEKAFPDYIKDGVVTCSFLYRPRLDTRWRQPQSARVASS